MHYWPSPITAEAFCYYKKRKESKTMVYEKVTPDLNFVEREKKTEKFWRDNNIFHIHSMTDLLQLTVSLISDTYLHVLSRI